MQTGMLAALSPVCADFKLCDDEAALQTATEFKSTNYVTNWLNKTNHRARGMVILTRQEMKYLLLLQALQLQ